ncbi:hypothetical protein CLAIMM_04566 isoform 3 [Cladophialophora immunda]|nr:hypothetical protein CLAIMM_04566 isoform 1 [Cladophialophora immunda]OQU98844.1 hypothetical protein CLAIMM_04566 isoform 2 [Cladophialophora immunda]OQU98845.1 hypothetical protein CLAIMM_04566 isoform 3 [Cladophialophora immunda]
MPNLWITPSNGAPSHHPPGMNLPPQAVNDLSKLLRTKSNKKSDEAWKDMVEVCKHEQESDRCARTANDIDAAIAASSAVLPPRFFHTPACSLLRQESLENRIKSKQEFQEALTEHYKASYERGQAATYNEDAQLLDDELKKRKKCCQSQCCNCRKKPTAIVVSPPFRSSPFLWFAS